MLVLKYTERKEAMSHEILSAKLNEMDTNLTKLHSRILNCEHLSDARLKEEIESLEFEIDEQEKLVFRTLLESKTDISVELRMEFKALKDKYRSTLNRFEKELEENMDHETQAEKKCLFAEYGVDFALITANHAMLQAMQAIQAQREQEKENKV